MYYAFLLLVMCISGCSYESLNTNKVAVEFTDVRFIGSMSPYDWKNTTIESRNPDLWVMLVDNYDENHSYPIELKLDIYIEMSDGRKCYVPDLIDINVAKQYSSKEIREGYWFNYFDEWDVEYILGDRWAVVYNSDNKLLKFSSIDYGGNTSAKERPAFWDSKFNKRYVLPLSYKKAIQLFGKSEKVEEWKAFY